MIPWRESSFWVPSKLRIGVNAGHSGDTPDTQTTTSVDAVVAPGGKKVGGETSKITLEQTEEQASVNVVTRAGRWMESLAAETAATRDRDAVPPVSLECIDEVMSEVQVEEDEVAEVARDEYILVKKIKFF